MGQADFIWVELGFALLLAVALVALPIAFAIALALIRLFRWRVARSMQAAAGARQDSERLAGEGSRGALNIELIEPARAGERFVSPLADARRQSRELAAIHAEAACVYPLVFVFLWWPPSDLEGLGLAILFGLFIVLLGTPVVFAGMMVFTKQPGLLALSACALVSVLLAFDIGTAADAYPMLYAAAAMPIVVVLMLMILRWQPRVVILIAFALIVLLWVSIPIWSRGSKAGTDLFNLFKMWLMQAGVPTVAVVLLSTRRLRAVGPVVFAATLLFLFGIVTGAGYASFFVLNAVEAHLVRADLAPLPLLEAISSLSLPEWLAVVEAVMRDPESMYRHDPAKLTLGVKLQSIGIFVCATTLGAVAASAMVPWLAGTYRRRRASDQMLTIDVMMLIFVVPLSLILTSVGESQLHGWLLGTTGLASFAGYKFWVRWRLRSWHRRKPAASPRTLLLLRVFGFDRRTQRLLEDVGERWRYLGPIWLISGPDLAYATLEPHEFFDFLNGRLTRAFIKDRKDLEARLDEASIVPDPDGRYRIEEFFCHDDTWRMTVARLAAESDAILMDLRGFSSANQGCIFEIEQLVAGVPLDRVLFLADASTDTEFLEGMLRRAWRSMPSDSPNAHAGRHCARILRATPRHGRTLRAVLELLCRNFPENAGA